MRTPAGFKKDMQFEMEVLKEHDAPGGAGQIVRGVHMRLHAGSHVDAPEHNVRGGTQIHQLPLELFMGDAIIADLRDKMPGKAITEKDLEKRLDNRIRKGDRLLLRTDHNNSYDGGSETWMKHVALSDHRRHQVVHREGRRDRRLRFLSRQRRAGLRRACSTIRGR